METGVQNRFGFVVDLPVDAEDPGHLFCSPPGVVGRGTCSQECNPVTRRVMPGFLEQSIVVYLFSDLEREVQEEGGLRTWLVRHSLSSWTLAQFEGVLLLLLLCPITTKECFQSRLVR